MTPAVGRVVPDYDPGADPRVAAAVEAHRESDAALDANWAAVASESTDADLAEMRPADERGR